VAVVVAGGVGPNREAAELGERRESSPPPRTQRPCGWSPGVVPVTVRAVATAECADEIGLRDAYLAHGGELLGFARRALATPGAAEDVVQETFARAWRSRHRFDSSLGSLRTWLFAIERRVIVDSLARITRSAAESLDGRDVSSGDEWIDAILRGWQVDAALARLPEEHRNVIVEMYFRGRTGREVAELLGVPEGTIRSRAFYALRLLRVFMEEAGWNE
jgi:RNA polymerase sigma-70 factor, ECF subfamily